ncbi:MAG: 3-dehydroquinate synthase [bacterium]|nr:3-dehydroquinate synthase [bacterium]
MTVPAQLSEITVGLGDRAYVISVANGLIDQVGDYARKLGFHSPLAIIADDAVAEIYGDRVKRSIESAGFKTEIIPFPTGETNKHLQTISALYDAMVQLKPERDGGVIALGGGVAGDMAGFVAATYLRGMRFIQVPTTLLAQVDASVGGKVGVDHAGGKNLIGAFHQPRAVLIDPDTLKSLDPRQVRSGLAEVIKHGVIQDAELFKRTGDSLDALLAVEDGAYNEIVPWNCRIKARVVEQDEHEHGLRAILNYGHTIGHAVEALTGYETLLHGEAVAIGMIAEAELGEKLGVTPPGVVKAIRRLIQKAGFPLEKPKLTADAMIDSMFRDKKVKSGQLRFVLPTRIGEVKIEAVTDLELIREVWANYHGA